MERRFARLKPGTPPFPIGFFGVPDDGMCLNTFVVLRSPGASDRVLLGQIAPDPRWAEAGALDADRVPRVGDRWMLPSCQLLLHEAPDDAARRVLREQLGLAPPTLPRVQVFSESYPRAGATSAELHWDLHFVYEAPGPAAPPTTPLWRRLDYVRVAELPRGNFARGHGDVLELIGLAPAP